MARYIDADELYKATQKRIAEANEARMAVVDDEFLDLINDAFTEDVAPRAEVAREIFEEIGKFLKEKQQAVDNIWCEIDEDDKVLDAFCMAKTESYFVVKNFIDELKKKYTKPEPQKGDHHE